MFRLPQRRKIYVDRLQTQLLWANLFYSCVILFIFLIMIFAPTLVTLIFNVSPQQPAQATDEFISLYQRFWPAIPIVLALIGFHSILLSHRLAGPLYRFRGVYRRMAKGDLTVRAGVRNGDYLANDAAAINKMIEGLSSRVQEIDRCRRELRRTYDAVEQAVGAVPPDLARKIGEFHEHIGLMDQAMRHFELPETDENAPTIEAEPTELPRPFVAAR